MITFIRNNYMKHVELADIAASANVSIGECCRCFQKMARETPNQYLTGWRVARAKELLDMTDETVTDIGIRVGFSDASYFIRCFRKRTGMTPKEYRDKKVKNVLFSVKEIQDTAPEKGYNTPTNQKDSKDTLQEDKDGELYG